MKSISKRLTISLSFTVVVVATIVIAAIYLSTISEARRELDKEADEIFTYLSGSLKSPVWNVNYELVKVIGDTVSRNELVSEMTVIDAFGAKVYQFSRETQDEQISRSGTLTHYDKVIGEISLSLSTASFHKNSRNLLMGFIVTILIILIALIAVTGFLIKTFLGIPLQRFDNIITDYAAGEYDLKDHDMPYVEFSPLYGVMVQMGKRIKTQFQELRKAEKKYRNIFNTIEEGYILSDIHGNILSANPSAARLLKFDSPARLKNQNMLADICIYPQYPSDIMSQFKEQGFLTNYLLRFRRGDGKEIVVDANLRLIRDEDGNKNAIEGTFRDVTQRILMEEELKMHKTELETRVAERTAQLNATLDALPDIMFEMDEMGKIFDFRVPKGRNMAMPPDAFMEKRIRDILPEDAARVIESAIVRARETGTDFERTFSMGMPDGLHWFELSMAAKSASGRTSRRYVMLVRDITARLKNERIIKTLFEISNAVNVSQDLEDLYKKIHEIIHQYIDTTNFGIALIDRENDELYFPYWQDEKDAQLPPIPNISDPETQSLCLEVIRTQAPLFLRKDDLQARLGTRELGLVGTPAAVWLGTPLAVGNRVIGVMVVQHYENMDHYSPDDVEIMTAASEQVAMAIARKQMEHQMTVARREAEHANRAKSDFLARMSHEIRTPMNAIIGFSRLVLGTDLTVKQAQYQEKIYDASRSLLTIINDILDFSKIEAGKLVMETVPFSLDTVLENVSNLVRHEAEKKELEFLLNISPELPMGLEGDPLRLGQVLINLSNNAIKFTQKGKVIISAEKAEENNGRIKIHFQVTDTGIGISPDRIDTLFKAFSQADSSTTRKFGGTGLGLAICQHLVLMMDGSIGVDSEPEKGSTFFFSAWFDLQQAQEAKAYRPMGSLEGLRVLVVDDLPDARQIFCNMLETFSFRSDQAGTGQEGLEKLAAAAKEGAPYDLVILDYFMPGMDGVTVGRKIMADPRLDPSPKIIMVSAYSREDIILNASKTGLTSFLIKPVSHSVMFDAIHEVFGLEAVRTRSRRIRPLANEADLARIKGARILLVEDNEINQQLAMEILNQAAFTVTIAANGVEAVAAVEKDDFDLVLMDIEMPLMDGYQATEAIRAKPGCETLPILAVTAHAMASYREKCLARGMSDYLTKPIDQTELFEKMIQWIQPGDREPVPEAATEEPAPPDGADILPDLPGFDMASALKRANQNHGLLARLLCQFRTKYRDADAQVRDLLDRKAVEDARKLSHAVKGVAGNLGAEDLFQAASDLNQCLQTGSAQNCEPFLERFSAVLTATMSALSILEKDHAGPVSQHLPQDVDMDACQDLVDRLHDLLAENDADAVAVAQTLGRITSGSPVHGLTQKLAGLVEEYEFDAALAELSRLNQALANCRSRE